MNSEKLNKYIAKPDTLVVDAMQKIDINAKGVLFIVDEEQKLMGSITDGDIRRWLIKTGDLKAEIFHLMNKNPKYVFRTDVKNAKTTMDTYKINALPVVTKEHTLCDIIYRGDIQEAIIDKEQLLKDVPVVVMAGGKGTRLYPYTKVLPKPLIPIGDIPIMERIINRFQEYGVQRFFATVNYRKNMIKSYFSDTEGNYSIEYVEEDKPLGTAGSLRLIEEEFTKPVIVTNCDILVRTDYDELYRHHCESGNEITIVSALKNIVVPYGVIHAKENGTIEEMEEKPKLSYFVNTGMYVLSPEALKKIPKDTFFHMTDLTNLLLKERKKVGMYPVSEDSFLDMGEFEEMRRMEQKLDYKSE